MYMAVINGKVCVSVYKGTTGAHKCGGTFWLKERNYYKRVNDGENIRLSDGRIE